MWVHSRAEPARQSLGSFENLIDLTTLWMYRILKKTIAGLKISLKMAFVVPRSQRCIPGHTSSFLVEFQQRYPTPNPYLHFGPVARVGMTKGLFPEIFQKIPLQYAFLLYKSGFTHRYHLLRHKLQSLSME